MDEEIRRLERLAQFGDPEMEERLWLAKDRAGAFYPVYMVTSLNWEFNDNWMSASGEEIQKVFRSKEKAQAYIRELTRDFLEERGEPIPESASLTRSCLAQFLGDEFQDYFNLVGGELAAFLRGLGCEVERSEESFWKCDTHQVDWTDDKVDKFLSIMRKPIHSVTEIVLQ